MLAPLNTAIEFLFQFQRLLPRGRVWHRGWGTVQAEDLLTLMPQIVRLNQRALDVLRETFPCTTEELLPEWEASLGLPDPCIGDLDTLQQRQQAVCLKFTARGGQSRDYFIRLAASIGFDITITTFRPFYCSEERCDDPLYDERWAYVWQVTATAGDALVYFRAGESAVDEPLVAFGNTLLECTLNAAKPAHGELIFAYVDGSVWDLSPDGTAGSAWDAGASLWDQPL